MSSLDPILYNLVKKIKTEIDAEINTINTNVAKNKIYSETHDIDSGDSYKMIIGHYNKNLQK